MDTAFQYWKGYFLLKEATLVSCFDNIPYIDKNCFTHPNWDIFWEKDSVTKNPQIRISMETSLTYLLIGETALPCFSIRFQQQSGWWSLLPLYSVGGSAGHHPSFCIWGHEALVSGGAWITVHGLLKRKQMLRGRNGIPGAEPNEMTQAAQGKAGLESLKGVYNGLCCIFGGCGLDVGVAQVFSSVCEQWWRC